MRISLTFLSFAAILLSHESSCQLEQFFAQYGDQCGKVGALWLLNTPCLNYNGSVECRAPTPVDAGNCGCNQGDNAYFDATQKICLGKVGAACTAEKTSLIPAKLCTPNADCFADQSEGHIVGTCKCLYGYNEENGLCVVDPDIGDDDRSTQRTTTIREAPDRGSFQLPSLELILEVILGRSVNFGDSCIKEAYFPLLNRSNCALAGMTVACADNKECQCNLLDDAIYDEELQLCVGKVDSYCLQHKNLLGYKACVEGADCELEAGLEEDQSFGTCKCLHGYDPQPDGTCLRDESIEDPATKRPGGPTPPTEPPETTTPYQGGGGGAAQITATIINVLAISILSYLLC